MALHRYGSLQPRLAVLALPQPRGRGRRVRPAGGILQTHKQSFWRTCLLLSVAYENR